MEPQKDRAEGVIPQNPTATEAIPPGEQIPLPGNQLEKQEITSHQLETGNLGSRVLFKSRI